VSRDSSPTEALNELTEKTIRGGASRLIAQAVNFLVRFGSIMVLARLLGPSEFGLVGMVTALTGILGLFRDFGLSAATVQRVTVSEEQASTLFWINVAVGGALTILTVAMAPAVAAFYHEPRLFWITVVLGSAFLFGSAGVQHSARLQRDMRFTALAVINTVSLLAGTAASIVMAKAGYGYWALVTMAVTIPLITTIGLWVSDLWLPGLPRRRIGLTSLMRFGGAVTLNSIVVYVAYNFEKVLLGRYWGAAAIGMYGRAYQLVSIPTDNLNSAVGEVAFSALSRVQDDPQRVRNYFLKGYSLILGLTIPCTLICALFASDLIAIFLGPKWRDVVPIFRLLAPTILAFALINPTGWLLFSLGKVGRSLKIAFVIAPLVITGYVLGLPFGPKGVALGYSSAMILWIVPHLIWSVHGTSISFKDIVRVLHRPILSGIVACLAAAVFLLLCGPHMAPLFRLALGLLIFSSIYICLLWYVMGEKALYMDVLRRMLGRVVSSNNVSAPTEIENVF